MARLSKTDWASVRAAWEASPRQGTEWLTAAGGGTWPVSGEAIRKRRLAEKWEKHSVVSARFSRLANIALAHHGADRSAIERARRNAAEGADARGEVGGVGWIGSSGTPAFEEPQTPPGAGASYVAAFTAAFPAEGMSDEEEDAARARLLVLHREDWRLARRLLDHAVHTADPQDSRVAKLNTETLRLIQEGERRAWGLDLELLDFQNLTDEQLQQVARGRIPR